MTSLPETINKKAAEAFPGCEVHIADLSNGCGAMYCVTLVWDKFEDMNRLKKHRLVNTTFKDEIKLMHAFEQVS
ncbi:hypothetical protein IWW50_002174 [Coemansia erecta]|nr:hypothetical protein IWW50_002174 [Coemansia erecta]